MKTKNGPHLKKKNLKKRKKQRGRNICVRLQYSPVCGPLSLVNPASSRPAFGLMRK